MLEDLINKLIKLGKSVDFIQGATLDQIENFEKENKISLPIEYKQWLMFTNGGELFIPGTTMFGIYNDQSQTYYGQLIYKKGIDSKYKMLSIPDNLLVIGRMNFGDLICIDITGNDFVLQWDHENAEEYNRWISFSEWLSESIDDYLMYLDNSHE